MLVDVVFAACSGICSINCGMKGLTGHSLMLAVSIEHGLRMHDGEGLCNLSLFLLEAKSNSNLFY